MGTSFITPTSPASASIAEPRAKHHAQLSPASLKLRDRFRDLTGFSRTIIHELGHAVVAAYLGQPLKSVTIEAAGNLAGACTYFIRVEHLGNNDLTANQAVVSMAARAAVIRALLGCHLTEIEIECSIDSVNDEYRLDELNLLHYARCLDIPAAEFEGWRNTKTNVAWEILHTPYIWQALQKLAKELKRERTMPGTRVYEVLAECRKEAEANA